MLWYIFVWFEAQRTVDAEDVEQHSSDLVVGAVRVEQHWQQSPHGIFHLHPLNVWPQCKVLRRDKQSLSRLVNIYSWSSILIFGIWPVQQNKIVLSHSFLRRWSEVSATEKFSAAHCFFSTALKSSGLALARFHTILTTDDGTQTDLLSFAEFLHVVWKMMHAVLGQLQMNRFLEFRENIKTI